MDAVFSFSILLPVFLLLLQAMLILFFSTFMLKKQDLLKLPYSGMEYSTVILAAAVIFSTLYIAAANTETIFQAYKTYQNFESGLFKNLFIKFAQSFLVIFCAEILFIACSFWLVNIFAGLQRLKEIKEGNLSLSILTATAILGFAVIMHGVVKEVLLYITPVYLNFR